jgi:hypothetical protein
MVVREDTDLEKNREARDWIQSAKVGPRQSLGAHRLLIDPKP